MSAIRLGLVILLVQAGAIVGLELGRNSALAQPFSGMGGSIAVAVISTALLMVFLQVTLLRPLNQLLRVMNQVEQGDLARRLPTGDARNALDAWFEMFNRLVDRLSESLLMWDRSQAAGRIGSWTAELGEEQRLEWSPGTCRIFGIEPGAFNGRSDTFFDAVHADDRVGVVEFSRQMKEGRREGSAEYRIRRADGKWRWLHQHANVELDAQEQPVRMIGIVQDITERRQIEEALRESEANLSAVFENTADSILAIDDGYRVVAANAAVSKNMSAVWSEKIKTGKNLLQQMPDEAVAIWKPRFDRGLQGERFLVEERYGEGAQTHDVEVRFNPIRNHGGIVGVSVFIRDITDRKKSENSLRESEERFRTLANAAPVGIFQTDLEGKCIYVNSTWCKLFGLAPQDALSDGWVQRLHQEDRAAVVEEWQSCLQNGDSSETEYRVQLANGRIRWIAGNAVPLPAATGPHRG
ncbi:MAG: PAS domain S-box protein, partial [Limisphaerales bacterium]